MILEKELDERYEFALQQLEDAFGHISADQKTSLREYFLQLEGGDSINLDKMHQISHLSHDNCRCIADAFVDSGLWMKAAEASRKNTYLVKAVQHF